MSLLRQFIEVADARSIAQAARSMGMTQPALSKNLKRLEDTVGASLFERHTKGSALTTAGEALCQRARGIILQYEHALQEVQNAMNNDEGILRIGAGAIFSSTIIPAAIPRFQKHYPKYRVSVVNLPMERLDEELALGRIDMTAAALVSKVPENVVERPIRQADLTILCARDHPLLDLPAPVPLAEVVRYPFVSFEPDHDLVRKLGHVLNQYQAPPPRYSVETTSIFGAVELVRSGTYLMYGSSLLAAYPIGRGLVSVPLSVSLGTYRMGFRLREGEENVPTYRGFLNVVRQEAMRGVEAMDGATPDL